MSRKLVVTFDRDVVYYSNKTITITDASDILVKTVQVDPDVLSVTMDTDLYPQEIYINFDKTVDEVADGEFTVTDISDTVLYTLNTDTIGVGII